MFNKLERYISKNIPDTAMQIINQKAHMIPHDYKGQPATGNFLAIWNGLQQRMNIEPKHYNLGENKEKIEVNIRGSLSPQMDPYFHQINNQRGIIRKVHIFQAGSNHMQSTPLYRKYQWVMQLETIGFYRHPTGTFRTTLDPYFKWLNKQDYIASCPNEVVRAAKNKGYEIDIIYRHQRYHTQKAYADNFLFEKESVSDVEDEDEMVSGLMQKI